MQSSILLVLFSLLVMVVFGRNHQSGNRCTTGNTCTCEPQRADVTVTWCKNNCFHNPPYCPSSHCICSGSASSTNATSPTNTTTTLTTNTPTPVCTNTTVTECTPRHVKKPREVCQTVFDLYEDTVVTENCEEVVTTTCTQISLTSTNTSQVVDKSCRLVEAGIPKPIDYAYTHPDQPHHAEAEHEPQAEAEAKAEPEVEAESEAKAEPEAEAESEAEAEAEAEYGHHSPVVSSHANKTVHPPECNSSTVKT